MVGFVEKSNLCYDATTILLLKMRMLRMHPWAAVTVPAKTSARCVLPHFKLHELNLPLFFNPLRTSGSGMLKLKMEFDRVIRRFYLWVRELSVFVFSIMT